MEKKRINSYLNKNRNTRKTCVSEVKTYDYQILVIEGPKSNHCQNVNQFLRKIICLKPVFTSRFWSIVVYSFSRSISIYDSFGFLICKVFCTLTRSAGNLFSRCDSNYIPWLSTSFLNPLHKIHFTFPTEPEDPLETEPVNFIIIYFF